MEKEGLSWRDSARPARVFGLDARLIVMCLLWFVWPSWWTTGALVLAFAGFRIAEARGYRVRAALRRVRSISAGRRRGVHFERYRRFVGS